MATKYGSPGGFARRSDRWLRRGANGLAAGRSEAGSPVELSGFRGKKQIVESQRGESGNPGPPLTDEVMVGEYAWIKAGTGNGGITVYGFPQGLNSRNIRWSGGASALTGGGATPTIGSVPTMTYTMTTDATNAGLDLAPREAGSITEYVNGSGSPGTIVSISNHQYVWVGQGNGRGGFHSVVQFAFHAMPTNRRWFVGAQRQPNSSPSSNSLVLGNPSAGLNMVGVGGDSGDTAAYFMHNDDVGSCTKVSTGITGPVADQVYEVRVLCDSQRSDAQISFEALGPGGVSLALTEYSSGSNLSRNDGMWGCYLTLYSGNSAATDTCTVWLRSMFQAVQPVGRSLQT